MTSAQIKYFENWGDPEYVIEQFDLLGILPHGKPNAIGLWPNEQLCLVWSAMQCPDYNNSNWLEIGSFCGGSAILLGYAKEAVDGSGDIIAVDPAPNPMIELNIKRSGLKNIKQYKCKGEHILQNYNEPISFAFIDGFHSFRTVIKDFEAVHSILDKDGIVGFHDVSPRMWQHDPEYMDALYDYVMSEWDNLMSSNEEDFRLDEAIAFICKDMEYEIIDIPVREPLSYFRETGLNGWVRGRTSPHNAYTAIRRKKQ